jgi:hypothetical protein
MELENLEAHLILDYRMRNTDEFRKNLIRC